MIVVLLIGGGGGFPPLLFISKKDMARHDIGDLSLTLEELKIQMEVDEDDHDRDEYIIFLGRTALSHVFHSTRRSREELAEMADGEDFPRSLRLAALQLAAHMFRVREPVASTAQHTVPMMYDCLVKPFVKLG